MAPDSMRTLEPSSKNVTSFDADARMSHVFIKYLLVTNVRSHSHLGNDFFGIKNAQKA